MFVRARYKKLLIGNSDLLQNLMGSSLVYATPFHHENRASVFPWPCWQTQKWQQKHNLLDGGKKNRVKVPKCLKWNNDIRVHVFRATRNTTSVILFLLDNISCFVSLGSEENRPRRVVRSISEGNLNLLEPQKSKSIFYKTSQQIKRVTKRL